MTERIERLWYPASPESPGRRLLLSPLVLAEGLFGSVVAARRALYDREVLTAERVAGLRVVSVGNLTVGGSGKTPVVIELATRLSKSGARVAVLSRGYGRASTQALSFDAAGLPPVEEAGDEPLLIATRCPDVTVWVGSDRVSLARAAQRAGADVAILDDGFQHRRLARDVDVVVIDPSAGFGNGHLLPRGPLREPVGALSRATLLWISGESSPPPVPQSRPVVRARHAPSEIISPGGAVLSLDALQGRAVVILCGIARPERFTRALTSRGALPKASFLVGDHRPFPTQVLEAAQQASEREGAWLVTTEKDRMRLPRSVAAHVLRLGVEVLEGEARLREVLGPG